MTKFIAGIVVGIVLATVGTSGIMKFLNHAAPQIDAGVGQVKQIAKEAAK